MLGIHILELDSHQFAFSHCHVHIVHQAFQDAPKIEIGTLLTVTIIKKLV